MRLIDDPLWGKIILVDSQKLQEILDKIEPLDLAPVVRCKERRMRLIDADALAKVKFHGYPEIEITPSDVNVEAYKRGWNDAIDAIIESAPSIDVVKHGRWIKTTKADYIWECSACGYGLCDNRTTYCYDCGARMDGEENG